MLAARNRECGLYPDEVGKRRLRVQRTVNTVSRWCSRDSDAIRRGRRRSPEAWVVGAVSSCATAVRAAPVSSSAVLPSLAAVTKRMTDGRPYMPSTFCMVDSGWCTRVT